MKSHIHGLSIRDVKKHFYRTKKPEGKLRFSQKLHRLFKREKETIRAVDGISLDVGIGEIYGILGANGSGKSTLIRLISTLLLPDAGSIHVFGDDVVTHSMKVRRVMNRVSVEASFFKRLSSAENLIYAARLYGIPSKVAVKKAEQILERLGFEAKRMDAEMEQLSRGMQQKVAIARALLTTPMLLLLDEPTTGLDPKSKRDVQTFIEEIRDERNAVILLTTALIWGFLSVMMREVSDAITWERWEGTIEYTFMAPIYRITHLVGSCLFAILYGLLRTGLVLAIMPFFFGEHIDLGQANWFTMSVTVLVSSLSFIGIGLMAAIFPLLSPEKGQAATGILQSLLLLVSGIYYEIEVLPEWLQTLSHISPATYTLKSIRAAMLENASIQSQAGNLILLLVIGIVLIPVGFYVFHLAEKYAKRVGRLKRSG